MLSQFIGNVDVNAAGVLIAIAVTICVIVTTMVSKRRSRRAIEIDFELGKMRLQNEDAANSREVDRSREYNLAKLASEREVEFKRIDGNMITSHTRTDS